MPVTIDFTEMGVRDGSSPLATFNNNSQTATRLIKVRWEDVALAYEQFLGYSEIVSGELSRKVPDYHPIFPWLWCTEVDLLRGATWVENRDYDGKNSNAYDHAFLRVTYTALDYDILTDDEMDAGGYTEDARYVTYSEDATAESIIIPGGFMRWQSGATIAGVVPFGIAKIQAKKELHYLWREIPYANVPESAIKTTIGTVNSTAFDDYPAGSLLCLPPRRTLRRNSRGGYCWDIEYRFLYFDKLHNNILQHNPAGTSAYWQVNRNVVGSENYYAPGSIPDGKCIYDEQDFADLFVVT